MAENRRIPFENFFLTNKPKEAFKISQHRTLKSVEPECEKYEGKMVMLCYETTLRPLSSSGRLR